MQCPQCPAENRGDRRFCGQCGASLASACPACGFSNEPDERFCGGCGQPRCAPPSNSGSAPAPQTYIPPHLAEKILTARSALEGERKQVTVLFADLKGSTELIRDLDPEDAQTLLDGALRRMMDAVHRFEGTVNQVMGDGIMALFGAPLAHEDHAVRACYAALAMGQALRQYGEEVRRRHALALDSRVGLNSGEVVVRAIANDLQMDYSAVGQTVHLAARMEQIAPPGGIVLAPATLALAEGFVQVRSLGLVPIRGLDASLEVYELLGAGVARTRLPGGGRPWVKPLRRPPGRVGGTLPRARADGRWARAALRARGRARGRQVTPGLGGHPFSPPAGTAHDPAAPGWLVLESGSVSFGKATAYRPVIEHLLVRAVRKSAAVLAPGQIRRLPSSASWGQLGGKGLAPGRPGSAPAADGSDDGYSFSVISLTMMKPSGRGDQSRRWLIAYQKLGAPIGTRTNSSWTYWPIAW